MTKTELLAKAKQDFPVGTVCESPFSGVTIEITEDGKFCVKLEHFGSTGYNVDFDGNYLYYRGKWATIISKPKLSLKAEAIKRYPEGTIVKCLSSVTPGKKYTVTSFNEVDEDGKVWMNTSDSGAGVLVYYKGEWAEIVPESKPAKSTKPFPKRMMCWDNNCESDKQEVFVLAKVYGKYQGVYIEDKPLLNDLDGERSGCECGILVTYQNAEDIPKEIIELEAKIKADTKRLNKLKNA